MFVYSDRGALPAQREEAVISPLLSCGASKLFPFTPSSPWNALPGKVAYFLHLTENAARLLFSSCALIQADPVVVLQVPCCAFSILPD